MRISNTAITGKPVSQLKHSAAVPLVIMGTVLMLFGIHRLIAPFWLFQHMANTADPFILADDARQQVWIFLKYFDPRCFTSDPIAEYYLNAFIPQGMKQMMHTLSLYFDPRHVAGVLTYLLFFIFTCLCVDTARRIGGWWAATGTLAFCLGCDFFLHHVTGGLPRNFALPLSALMIWSLVTGRCTLLAVTTVMASGFYYVTAAVGGLSLAVLLLIFPGRLRGNARSWSWTRRVTILAISGFLCMAVFLSGTLHRKDYGPLITPDQYTAYPEAGPGGRYFLPREPIWEAVLEWGVKHLQKEDTLVEEVFSLDPGHPARKGLLLLIAIFCLPGFWILKNDKNLQRLILFPMAAFTGYLLAAWAFPFLFYPVRYIKFILPVLFIILVPAAITTLFRPRIRRKKSHWTGAFSLAFCLLILLFFGQRDPRAGMIIKVPQKERPVLSFLESLPKNSLIAGWPKGIMDHTPLLAKQSVLINYETHLMFHQKFVEQARERMNAVVDALYAHTPEPLIRLKERFKVTHLVVEPNLLYKKCPEYFEPFPAYISNAFHSTKEELPLVLKLRDLAEYKQADGFFVLDLSSLLQ